MNNLSEIIKKRSTPGILIFDLQEKLLYSNPEALDIMPVLGGVSDRNETAVPYVPEEVLELLKKLKQDSTGIDGCGCIEQNCAVVSGAGNPCALRAFHIGHLGENKNPTHIMVMVEKIVETHKPDFNKAKQDYDLSKRETEVLSLICRGFGNKAISDELFISEYTVKDHIKKIMQKMNVRSRSEMIARLK